MARYGRAGLDILILFDAERLERASGRWGLHSKATLSAEAIKMRIQSRDLIPIANETARTCVVCVLLIVAPIGVIGLMIAVGLH